MVVAAADAVFYFSIPLFADEQKTRNLANRIMDGFFKKVNQRVNLGRHLTPTWTSLFQRADFLKTCPKIQYLFILKTKEARHSWLYSNHLPMPSATSDQVHLSFNMVKLHVEQGSKLPALSGSLHLHLLESE